MICGEYVESNQQEVQLGENLLTGSAVSECITYLYTGLMKIPENIDLVKLEEILQGESKI